MNAKERARVHRLLRKWQQRLLLQAWAIDVTFSDEHHPVEDGRVTYLTVSPDSRYSRFYVTVWMDFWTITPAEQEEWLYHELCHGPLSDLSDLACRAVRRKQAIAREVENAEERSVEWFCRVIKKAYG